MKKKAGMCGISLRGGTAEAEESPLGGQPSQAQPPRVIGVTAHAA